MNKRIILAWISILPPIFLILYIVIFQHIIEVQWVDVVLFTLIIVLFCIDIYYSLFVSFILCTPKSKLPKNIDNINYKGKIIVEEIESGLFNIIFEHKRPFIIDMRGWIFKKTYIKDILLMYYHFNYYNMNKYKTKKCLSKKYFIGENIKVSFKLKSGKEKDIWMVKNGKERRSIICDWKIFITCTGALKFKHKYEKDEYVINSIHNTYM